MGDLLAALRFGFVGWLHEALNAPGDGLWFAVAARLFEEEYLVEEFFDGSAETSLVLLERVAYVEWLQAGKHLREKSFLGCCRERFELRIALHCLPIIPMRTSLLFNA